ncbi:MAG TPA: triose-phosphate isomerase [Candidatus Omnitrophota bacterium]|nr:triose-phosphate isomerase [Candidatus Omnitrophota bacterium]
MRKPIIAGNWKMYKNLAEAVDFTQKLIPLVSGVTHCTILVCPPYPLLKDTADEACGTNIMVGAQNLYWEDEGAFTGEVSASMIKSVGCTYVIIGHSERRQYFCETDETVNKKLFAALKHNLLPVVCVGETLAEREKGDTFAVIEKQVKGAFSGLTEGHWQSIVIAYEPVWAIGTGKTATPEQAQEVHAFIRGLLPKNVAADIRILYGGSVKPENIKELMSKPEIDGGLVGGASLKPDRCAKIINYL